MDHIKDCFGLSDRRASHLTGLCRNTLRYKSKPNTNMALRKRMKELAQRHRKFGSPRLHVLLKREGLVVNHKRTERIYKEEELSLRRRKRRRKASVIRIKPDAPTAPDQKWSMDFVHDQLANGRRLRCLTIVDDYTRECVAIEVDTSLNGQRVARVLDRLAYIRGLPCVITVDNGPEFAGKVMDEWAYKNRLKLDFITPGKPIENAYIESFNGKFREECLNDNWFFTIWHARDIIDSWRADYNSKRPHSSLGFLTPDEYKEKWMASQGLAPVNVAQA